MAAQTRTAVLTIVRHGQTEANNKQVIQGWTDTPLNDFGMKQAKAAGQALKDVKFHQAYSSDLKRANKTCQIILEENQNSVISAENIKQDKLLREKKFGVLEGGDRQDNNKKQRATYMVQRSAAAAKPISNHKKTITITLKKLT